MTAVDLAPLALPATRPEARAADQTGEHLAVHAAAEAVATFTLTVLLQVLTALVIVPGIAAGPLQTLAAATAVFVVIAAIVLSPLGKLSGAHMNPAVTLAFFLEGRLSGRELAAYVAGQTVGAVLATLTVATLLPDAFALLGHGLIRPQPDLAPTTVFALEFSATFLLIVALFFMTADPARAGWTWIGKAGYFFLVTLVLRDATGAGLNPVRALAPALVAAEFDGVTLYVAASLAGAASAAFVCRLLPRAPRPVHHRFGLPHRHGHYTADLIARLRAARRGRPAPSRLERPSR